MRESWRNFAAITRAVLALYCVENRPAIAQTDPTHTKSVEASHQNQLIHEYRQTYTVSVGSSVNTANLYLAEPQSAVWQKVLDVSASGDAKRFVSPVFDQPFWAWMRANSTTGDFKAIVTAKVQCTDFYIDKQAALKVKWDMLPSSQPLLPLPKMSAGVEEVVSALAAPLRHQFDSPFAAMEAAYVQTDYRWPKMSQGDKAAALVHIAEKWNLNARTVICGQIGDKGGQLASTRLTGEFYLPTVGWVPFDFAQSTNPLGSPELPVGFGALKSRRLLRLVLGDQHTFGTHKLKFSEWGNVEYGDGPNKQAMDYTYLQPPTHGWTDPTLDNRPIACLVAVFSDTERLPFTMDEVRTFVLGPQQASFRDYLSTSSYGKITLAGSEVYGVLRLDHPASHYAADAGVAYDAGKNAMLQGDILLKAAETIDLRKYRSAVMIHPLHPKIGSQGGGRYFLSSGEEVIDTIIPSNKGRVALGGALIHFPDAYPFPLLAHEGGHSFGLDHSLDCDAMGPFFDFGKDPRLGALIPTYTAWHRLLLGVFDPADIAEVEEKQSRKVLLLPLNTKAKGVKVVRTWNTDHTSFWLVEARERDCVYDQRIQSGVYISHVVPARDPSPSGTGRAVVDRVSAVPIDSNTPNQRIETTKGDGHTRYHPWVPGSVFRRDGIVIKVLKRGAQGYEIEAQNNSN